MAFGVGSGTLYLVQFVFRKLMKLVERSEQTKLKIDQFCCMSISIVNQFYHTSFVGTYLSFSTMTCEHAYQSIHPSIHPYISASRRRHCRFRFIVGGMVSPPRTVPSSSMMARMNTNYIGWHYITTTVANKEQIIHKMSLSLYSIFLIQCMVMEKN